MNNDNDEELIKRQFIDKILKSRKSQIHLATKIFEEYVKCKNAVNIYLQANGTQNNINNKKYKKNIYKYNNIKSWIKMIIKPEDIENASLMSKKSYSYANIKSDQVPKPLGDINLPILYHFKDAKHSKNFGIYSTTTNIFDYTNFTEQSDEIIYNDEMILDKLKQYYMNLREDFMHLMQLGLPNSFRLISWNIVNNIYYSNEINYILNNKAYNSNNLYKKFLLKFLEKTKSDLIYRDIKRTFPFQNYDSINKSKKENDEKSLYNVLKAFWSIDEEIGYCQGMNYITGFLLLISDFDERNTFFLLISVFSQSFVKRKKNNFSLRGLFIEEFPLLYFYLFIFDDLLMKYIPELKNHLINNEIPNDVWIIKWFQTAFTIILPLNWSKKLWDNIFSSDFYFIIKFSISFCIFLSKDILALNDQQQIMDYFRNIQKIPMNFINPFLENKFDINDLIEKARTINIDIENYILKYEQSCDKGKKFKENIYKINDIKYFDINVNVNNLNNNFSIKKTNTTVKDSKKEKNKDSNIFSKNNNNLINDVSTSIITKNGSNKILKFAKHSFASKSNSSDINNIKLNSNKRLCVKNKLAKKKEINKVEYNKKLTLKSKLSNSTIHNNNSNNNSNSNNNIIADIKSKNHSPRLLNNIKSKENLTKTSESKKDNLIIQTKPFNFSKIIANISNYTSSTNNNNNTNINVDSMNTMVNKKHYQKILYKRKKNLGNIPKRNGFSSSNIKNVQKKNSANKTTEISDLLNSTKKNLSKDLHHNANSNKNNNNSKENDIRIKNTIMKNKMASISLLNNKNNLESNSRNNLINELKKRKQYLNKQIKYFLTNDSSKVSNNSFLNTDKKKIVNLGSNSKNNIKENEKNNNNKMNKIHKDTKPTKYIKINI